MELQVRRVPTKLDQTAHDFARSEVASGVYTTVTNLGYQTAQLVGHRIYLFGIGGIRRDPRCFIAVLDIRIAEWKWILCEGPKEAGCQVFLYNDCIYHYGIVDWRNKTSRRLSKFDLAFDEWSYCYSSGSVPTHRQYFSGHLVEEKNVFLVFGGSRGETLLTALHLLRLPQFAWIKPKVTGSIPIPRSRHGSCVYQGAFYFYGDIRVANDLYILHFESLNRATWSNAKTNTAVIGKLSSFAMAPFGKALLILGGKNEEFHQVSMYNPATNRCCRVSTRNSEELCQDGLSVVPLDGGRALGLFKVGNLGPTFYRVTSAD